jgi:hypothetical protein
MSEEKTWTAEMFDLGNNMYLCCDKGNRWHGWLFTKHVDGYHISVRKLTATKPVVPNKGIFKND